MTTFVHGDNVYPTPDIMEQITKDDFEKLIETSQKSISIRFVEPAPTYYWSDGEGTVPLAVCYEPYGETPATFYKVQT